MKRYDEMDEFFKQLCKEGKHAGVLTPDDLANIARMSPGNARWWLRALCRAHGYQWTYGNCLCPEK